MLNIVFMGTPDFAKESLESIYEKGHNILAVITKEDKQQGRGLKLIENPVKKYAKSKGIKVYQPTKIKNNNEIINIIEQLKPDVICVVAYGKILPKQILDIPKLGCINVHGSLLPKYRGAAPIQWAVINGDKITGITTMYMDENMDTGDIILKKEIEIGKYETTGELWNKLSKIGGELLVETLEKIENGDAPRIKQGQEFSLAPMLDKQISKIDWNNQTSTQIFNLSRGLDPIMGIYSTLNGKKLKLWKINIKDDFEEEINEIYSPGTVIYVNGKKGLYIKTKDGIIEVLEIQPENSKRMNILEFLRGAKISIGERFE
ncbi:MAG TPA: methionyl-tRNA formyltransferase [Clostridia bacterium]|nr:methionyl-tRNA formyltransferase [Clostridia bacterium]